MSRKEIDKWSAFELVSVRIEHAPFWSTLLNCWLRNLWRIVLSTSIFLIDCNLLIILRVWCSSLWFRNAFHSTTCMPHAKSTFTPLIFDQQHPLICKQQVASYHLIPSPEGYWDWTIMKNKWKIIVNKNIIKIGYNRLLNNHNA